MFAATMFFVFFAIYSHMIQSLYRMGKSVLTISTRDNPVTALILILDMDGLRIEQITHIPTLSYVLGWLRRHFILIETYLYHGYIINVNAVAQAVINLARPILASVFERVEIYGTNKSKYIPHLLKRCPKEALPVWYGGSKEFKPVKIYG